MLFSIFSRSIQLRRASQEASPAEQHAEEELISIHESYQIRLDGEGSADPCAGFTHPQCGPQGRHSLHQLESARLQTDLVSVPPPGAEPVNVSRETLPAAQSRKTEWARLTPK